MTSPSRSRNNSDNDPNHNNNNNNNRYLYQTRANLLLLVSIAIYNFVHVDTFTTTTRTISSIPNNSIRRKNVSSLFLGRLGSGDSSISNIRYSKTTTNNNNNIHNKIRIKNNINPFNLYYRVQRLPFLLSSSIQGDDDTNNNNNNEGEEEEEEVPQPTIDDIMQEVIPSTTTSPPSKTTSSSTTNDDDEYEYVDVNEGDEEEDDDDEYEYVYVDENGNEQEVDDDDNVSENNSASKTTTSTTNIDFNDDSDDEDDLWEDGSDEDDSDSDDEYVLEEMVPKRRGRGKGKKNLEGYNGGSGGTALGRNNEEDDDDGFGRLLVVSDSNGNILPQIVIGAEGTTVTTSAILGDDALDGSMEDVTSAAAAVIDDDDNGIDDDLYPPSSHLKEHEQMVKNTIQRRNIRRKRTAFLQNPSNENYLKERTNMQNNPMEMVHDSAKVEEMLDDVLGDMGYNASFAEDIVESRYEFVDMGLSDDEDNDDVTTAATTTDNDNNNDDIETDENDDDNSTANNVKSGDFVNTGNDSDDYENKKIISNDDTTNNDDKSENDDNDNVDNEYDLAPNELSLLQEAAKVLSETGKITEDEKKELDGYLSDIASETIVDDDADDDNENININDGLTVSGFESIKNEYEKWKMNTLNPLVIKRKLIPIVKRNEETDQMFALDKLDDEFERVMKEYQDDDDNNGVIDVDENSNTNDDSKTNEDSSFLPTLEQTMANLIGYNLNDNKKSHRFHQYDAIEDMPTLEESIDVPQTLAKLDNVTLREMTDVIDGRIIVDKKSPLVYNEAPYQPEIERLLLYDLNFNVTNLMLAAAKYDNEAPLIWNQWYPQLLGYEKYKDARDKNFEFTTEDMNNADIYELRDYYKGLGFDKIPKKGLENENGKNTGTGIVSLDTEMDYDVKETAMLERWLEDNYGLDMEGVIKDTNIDFDDNEWEPRMHVDEINELDDGKPNEEQAEIMTDIANFRESFVESDHGYNDRNNTNSALSLKHESFLNDMGQKIEYKDSNDTRFEEEFRGHLVIVCAPVERDIELAEMITKRMEHEFDKQVYVETRVMAHLVRTDFVFEIWIESYDVEFLFSRRREYYWGDSWKGHGTLTKEKMQWLVDRVKHRISDDAKNGFDLDEFVWAEEGVHNVW